MEYVLNRLNVTFINLDDPKVHAILKQKGQYLLNLNRRKTAHLAIPCRAQLPYREQLLQLEYILLRRSTNMMHFHTSYWH